MTKRRDVRRSIPVRERGRVCVVCGCRDGIACVDIDLRPCAWLTPTTCTHCADRVPAWKPGQKVYSGKVFQETLSVAVWQLALDRETRPPQIIGDSTVSLTLRQDLLDSPFDSMHELYAISILADCLGDDAVAKRLGASFADTLDWSGNFLVNEFEIRTWWLETDPHA